MYYRYLCCKFVKESRLKSEKNWKAKWTEKVQSRNNAHFLVWFVSENYTPLFWNYLFLCFFLNILS